MLFIILVFGSNGTENRFKEKISEVIVNEIQRYSER